jgi:hypothetical protein
MGRMNLRDQKEKDSGKLEKNENNKFKKIKRSILMKKEGRSFCPLFN